MKPTILALLLSVLISSAYSQSINYEKSFSDALAKASAQNKLVFLQFNTPINPHQKKFTSGLESPKVVAKYNKKFISYQLSWTDTAAIRLRKKYPSSIYPAYFFIDKQGNPVYSNFKNSADAKKYILMADSALKMAKSGKDMSDYEARYKAGKINGPALKEYITLREKFGLYDNAKLIEDYVNYLPISALNNYQDVLFILKAGPIAYGRAFNLAYTNRKITDSIYKTAPSADRSAMNSRMISNTYKEAVASKNAGLAQQLSNFTRNAYRSNFRIASRQSTQMLISYYQAVKDTANYLRQALYFYDGYYMNISADSIKRMDETRRKVMLKAIHQRNLVADSARKMDPNNSKFPLPSETFTIVSSQSQVSNILNNAAYAVFTTGTHNPNYIIKAITWSRRSIALKPEPSHYDTLAHLLYRYGFYAEAESAQNTAIDMAGKLNDEQRKKYYTVELTKIKNHNL